MTKTKGKRRKYTDELDAETLARYDAMIDTIIDARKDDPQFKAAVREIVRTCGVFVDADGNRYVGLEAFKAGRASTDGNEHIGLNDD